MMMLANLFITIEVKVIITVIDIAISTCEKEEKYTNSQNHLAPSDSLNVFRVFLQ